MPIGGMKCIGGGMPIIPIIIGGGRGLGIIAWRKLSSSLASRCSRSFCSRPSFSFFAAAIASAIAFLALYCLGGGGGASSVGSGGGPGGTADSPAGGGGGGGGTGGGGGIGIPSPNGGGGTRPSGAPIASGCGGRP